MTPDVEPHSSGGNQCPCITSYVSLYVSAIVRAISLCLLTLGLFTFVLYLVGDRLEAGWKWFFQRQKYQEKKGSGLSAEELSHQQRAVCERIQNEYNEKASRYEAEVARPRREAKKAQLEREFYKFAGPAWKGGARSLDDNQGNDEKAGSASKQQLPRKGAQGTSKDAATVRKLPDSATRQPQAVPNKPQQVKKVIVLPNEPDTRDKKCITVALRGLRSTVTKRRFLYTEKVQVLLDWMAKQGYHPKLYTVCTTFPRRDLSQHAEETLEDMHLVRDVVLAIEERE
ncbi:UBX domain-containing protein 8-like [Acanthaster planci]|uniref:UBX domain-containing protein 8-like n=1 Tax=Acanthaster planci TaxID=133434 RepID=A0A8B7XLG4_ACAPL|nr:UBX domain-containing protein 8-like [Acanthaster planci]